MAFGETDMSVASFVFAIVFAAALVSGIVGGIVFAFSSFVISALARIPATGVGAMNSINAAVINVSFMTVFMGTAILCLIAGAASFLMRNQPGAEVTLAASVVYFWVVLALLCSLMCD